MSTHSPGSGPTSPPASTIRRLYVLLCGFEILPIGVSLRGTGNRFILSEPVCAYLLDTEQGWVLLDAGLNPDNGNDPQRVQERFGRFGMNPPVIRKQHRLDEQLAQLGLRYSDIGWVILSHLHYDHGGELRHFSHARLSIQRREYQHAFGPDPGMAYFRDEYDLPGLRWELQDGDWQALPGLELLDTRGHTQGHQSALITLQSGRKLLLPFDAADLQANLDADILPGECCDDAAAAAALQRLRSMAAEQNATILLFHDPVAIQRQRLCPEFYD